MSAKGDTTKNEVHQNYYSASDKSSSEDEQEATQDAFILHKALS